MTDTKRHLVRGNTLRTACGLSVKARNLPVTNMADQVTCLGCKRTMQMADAEVAQRNR